MVYFLTVPTAQRSSVHSQTFPAILCNPNLLGGKESTGDVNVKPSSAVLVFGKSPCQMLALQLNIKYMKPLIKSIITFMNIFIHEPF